MSPARFHALADPLLANSLATIRDYIAIWIEDERGQIIASSGPEPLIATFSCAKTIVRESRRQAWRSLLAKWTERSACHSQSRCKMQSRQLLGTIMVLVDFSPTALILMDSSALDETGEVLVGVRHRNAIRLITATRGRTPKSEVLASSLPSARGSD